MMNNAARADALILQGISVLEDVGDKKFKVKEHFEQSCPRQIYEEYLGLVAVASGVVDLLASQIGMSREVMMHALKTTTVDTFGDELHA